MGSNKTNRKRVGQRTTFYSHQYDRDTLTGTIRDIFFIDDMKFYVVKVTSDSTSGRYFVTRFGISLFKRDCFSHTLEYTVSEFKDSFKSFGYSKTKVNDYLKSNIETIRQVKNLIIK
jgi:hypothetical protein